MRPSITESSLQPDILLLWLGVFSAVLNIAVRPGLWTAKALFVLLVAFVSIDVVPLAAGWIVGAAWLVLLAAPALLLRLSNYFTVTGRYTAGAAATRALWLLHPDPTCRPQAETLKALVLARRGQFQEAIACLQQIIDAPKTPRPPVLSALMHQRRLQGRLDLLLDEIDWAKEEPVTAAVVRFRALSALGRVADIVALQEHERWRLRDVRVAASWAWAYGLLALLVATGRVVALDRLFAGPMRSFPAEAKALQRALASLAADGMDAQALASVQGLTGAKDRDIALQASRALAAPPAAVALRPAEAAVVDEAVADLDAYVAAWAARPRLRTSPLTLVLIALNCAMFAAELWLGGSENDSTLMRLGALWPPYVTEQGQWWRIGAASFLHLGWMHLGLNMLALGVLGPVAEGKLGRWRMLATYVAAALGTMGGLVLLVQRGWIGNEIVVGASGAIMGLVGALSADAARTWWHMRTRAAAGRFLLVAGVIILQTILDSVTPEVSLAGHAIGAAIGFIAALGLARTKVTPVSAPAPQPARPTDAPPAPGIGRRRALLTAGAAAAGLVLAVLFPDMRRKAATKALSDAARPAPTPVQISAVRRLRFTFLDFIENGTPAVNPLRPFGSKDAMADLSAIAGTSDETLLRELYIEAMRLLPLFCEKATLQPGRYAVDGDIIEISSDQIRLIPLLIWDIPDFASDEVEATDAKTWPVDMVHAKRPYGDMTFFEMDMADALGLPVGKDARGRGTLPDDVVDRLDALHRSMPQALAAFVRYAVWA